MKPVGATGSTRWTLPNTAATPSSARKLVVRWMADRHTADALAHDVALVCSELVTNVVLHATGPVRLTISCHDGGFLVEVGDDESSLARRAAPDEGPHATGGRGLAIVQAVAAAWGVTPDSGSKTVWALVRRRA